MTKAASAPRSGGRSGPTASAALCGHLEDAPATSISETAYQRLRSLILSRELPPGTLVSERKLAEALGASRTPLRAAISRLEGEGLIERSASGGFLIRQVSVDELLDILSIRRLLEGEAAALSAERMDPAATAELTACSRAIAVDPAVDVERFWAYDDAFHQALARGSGKPQLARIIEELRGRARMCHLKTMDLHFAPQAREHLLVLEAIARRDVVQARQAMRRHSDRVRDRLLQWLAR